MMAGHQSDVTRASVLAGSRCSTGSVATPVSNQPNPNPKITNPTPATKKSKTVSFHSATSLPTERKISSACACVDYMMRGSSLLKVRPNSRQYHRFFTLSEDMNTLRWTPTTKKSSKATVPICSMKEIRSGKNTDVLRARELTGGYTEDCAFSILYGDNFESLDLVASTAEEANIWVTGLNALLGAHKYGLEEKQALRERWLQEEFEQAASANSGCLDQCTAISLIQRLSGSGHITTVRIKQKLAEFDQTKVDGRRGTLDSREFVDMFKEITTRPEVYFLLIRFSNKDYLNIEDLQLFLEGEQGMMNLTPEKCARIIQQFEPTQEARENSQMLIDGFTKYLLSEECDIFESSHREVCQDMKQPLSHYFISSSHNTYLLEDQLKGPSSVEGIIRALTNGCRCIKLDCWDGPEEPIVYHGNTLTSRVPFRDCIEVVRELAFVYSQYPLIIHLENHCGLDQQRKVAHILRKLFQHMLFIHKTDSDRDVTEMSPHELRGKIIVMGKRLPLDRRKEVGDVTDEDESMEGVKRKDKPRRVPLCRELSDLISLVRLRFIDFSTSKQIQTPLEMCSMSESAAGKLAHTSPDEFVNHNKTFLTRIFPNAGRVDSSNYNPQDFWNCGCQMVALNFQTPGQMMDLYDGRFRQNGGCGYILKPAIMREHMAFFSTASKDLIPGVSPQMLHLKIISGQHLPRPKGSTAKGNVIDPYVVIQLYGIPADCTERRTKAVSNEGDSPIFEESFEFQVLLPELLVIRFVVLDDDYIGDDFIGQYTIPFDCLLTGYRHIRLLTNTGEQLDNCTLFVHVAISNKKGGGRPLKKKSKAEKQYTDIRMVGVRQIDDILKSTTTSLSEALKIRLDAEQGMHDLREECGLSYAANMKQCLRVLLHRLSITSQIHNISIQAPQGLPILKVEADNLPPHLHRSIVTFERTMMELQYMADNADRLKEKIHAKMISLLEFYEDLPNIANQTGIKGKKYNRMQENYTWNMRTLRGQVDLLITCKEECLRSIYQVQSSASTVGIYSNRERSPSLLRSHRQLTLHYRRTSSECMGAFGAPVRNPRPLAPLSPLTDIKPKSILKKSNSNIEPGSVRYVRLSPTSSCLRSNSWDVESNVVNKNS